MTKGPTPTPVIDRLVAHMEIHDRGFDSPCWESTYAPNTGGYGVIKVRPLPANQMVHRVAYELLVAEIPEGLVLDHLCRNRICFNPDHLEPVTDAVNILRGTGWSARNAAKTRCVNGHVLDEVNVRLVPNGRECMRCDNDRTKARYAEERDAKLRDGWMPKRLVVTGHGWIRGVPRCECGAESTAPATTSRAQKAWHRDHKWAVINERLKESA